VQQRLRPSGSARKCACSGCRAILRPEKADTSASSGRCCDYRAVLPTEAPSQRPALVIAIAAVVLLLQRQRRNNNEHSSSEKDSKIMSSVADAPAKASTKFGSCLCTVTRTRYVHPCTRVWACLALVCACKGRSQGMGILASSSNSLLLSQYSYEFLLPTTSSSCFLPDN